MYTLSRLYSTTARLTSMPKSPELKDYVEYKDNIEDYIIRFERFAKTNGWPENGWATHLSALLSGKALEVYSRLSPEAAVDFDKLKKAILSRYDLNAEGFRKKLTTIPRELRN